MLRTAKVHNKLETYEKFLRIKIATLGHRVLSNTWKLIPKKLMQTLGNLLCHGNPDTDTCGQLRPSKTFCVLQF